MADTKSYLRRLRKLLKNWTYDVPFTVKVNHPKAIGGGYFVIYPPQEGHCFVVWLFDAVYSDGEWSLWGPVGGYPLLMGNLNKVMRLIKQYL